MESQDKNRMLMMAFLDDELDEEQRNDFREKVNADPELAAELASYTRLVQITNSMTLREPEDYEYERFFARLSSRVERRLGFALLGLGAMIIASFAIVETLFSNLSLGFKLGVGIVLFGAILLVSSVVRVWIRLRRLDRYQGVKR